MAYRITRWAVLAMLATSPAIADHRQHPFSDWTLATAVQEVNTTFNDGCPIEAPDGRHLFIASNRPGALGTTPPIQNDIWVAKRDSLHSYWQEPVNLGEPISTIFNDFCPTPLPGNYLLFVSERPVAAPCSTGPGSGDIYITRKTRRHGWQEPLHLGCVAAGNGPNSAAAEFSPSLVVTKAGTFLYFSSGAAGTQDIYVSRMRRDGRFGTPTLIAELSTPSDDRMPNVSPNGLEMVFSSNRPTWGDGQLSHGGQDVYVSRRRSVHDAWSAPQNLGPNVNTTGNETRSTISWDRLRLHFGRDGNVYTSTRIKLDDRDDD